MWFPAAAPSAEQHALLIRDGEVYIFESAICAVRVGKRHILHFDHMPTAFHTISAARNAAKNTIVRKSADLI